MNNDVALEENSVFVIEITNKNTPSYVVGGDTTNGMLYDRISVTIADDDSKFRVLSHIRRVHMGSRTVMAYVIKLCS